METVCMNRPATHGYIFCLQSQGYMVPLHKEQRHVAGPPCIAVLLAACASQPQHGGGVARRFRCTVRRFRCTAGEQRVKGLTRGGRPPIVSSRGEACSNGRRGRRAAGGSGRQEPSMQVRSRHSPR